MTRTHPGRFHIAIPGPTNIPERILNAMHISSEDRETPRFQILQYHYTKMSKNF